MGMAPSATQVIQEFKPITVDREKHKLVIGPCPPEHGVQYSRTLVQEALREGIDRVDTGSCEAGEEDAFYVADLGEVYRQFLRWKINLPRVKPHYGLCFRLPEMTIF